jgi:tetratricopeptide (TPR) repeat protein
LTRLLLKSVGLIFVLCVASHLSSPEFVAWAQQKMPDKVKIVAPDGLSTKIHVKPDPRSETLQIALDGDVFETVGLHGTFYEVRVPDKRATGFVLATDTVPWKNPAPKGISALHIVLPILGMIALGIGVFLALRAKKDKEISKQAAAIPNAIRRAEEFFRAGDYAQAIVDFNHYLRLQGGEVRNPDVYRRLAVCYRKTEEIREAAESWEKMRELGGVKTIDDYTLGVELMIAQGKEAVAAELYEDLLLQEAAHEKELEIRQKLVEAYRKLKETRKYLKHAVSLMGLSGSDPNLLSSTVNFLISEGQTDLAVEFDHKDLITAICREFLEDKAMSPQAERIYLKCLAYDRTDVKLHRILAKIYSQSGDFKKAVSELTILAQIDKDQTESFIEEAARLYVETGHVPEALAEGNPMIVKKIAQIFLARSEVHPHAVETYEKVLEFQPRAVGINKMLSTVYLTRGELDKYMPKLRLLHEIDGQSRDYLTDLALCIIDNDLIDQTLKEGNRELNTKILRQLIKRGATNDKAVALLEKLGRTEPDNVVVRGALIKAYERRGDPEKCFEHLLLALQVQPNDRDLAGKAAAIAVQQNMLDRVLEHKSPSLLVATAHELVQSRAKLALTRQVLEQAVVAAPDQRVLHDYLSTLPAEKRGPAKPTSGVATPGKVTTGVTQKKPTTVVTAPPKTPTVITEEPRREIASPPAPPPPAPSRPQPAPKPKHEPATPPERQPERPQKSVKTGTAVVKPPPPPKKQPPAKPKRPQAPEPPKPRSEQEPTVSSVTSRPLETEQIVEFIDSGSSPASSGATTFVSGFARDRGISDYRPEELLRPATGGLAYKETDVLVTDDWGTINFGIEVNTNRSVLIRLLKRDLLERTSMKSFVDDVSEIMYNLRHENILGLEDIVSGITGVVALVHPYMFKTLEQAMKFGKRPHLNATLALMKNVVDAVGYAHYYQGFDGRHRRTYHFHLQPSLVLLSEDLKQVRVTGFGFSQIFRNFTRASKPRWQEPGMNPATMPPEFFRSRVGTIRERAADIYSLGAVLYFIATGEYPFEGPSFEDYKFGHTKMVAAPARLANPSVPEWVDMIILKCLEKDPEKRWENVTEIQEAFKKGLGA